VNDERDGLGAVVARAAMVRRQGNLRFEIANFKTGVGVAAAIVGRRRNSKCEMSDIKRDGFWPRRSAKIAKAPRRRLQIENWKLEIANLKSGPSQKDVGRKMRPTKWETKWRGRDGWGNHE